MSSTVKSLNTLYYNPFILTSILISFYKNYRGVKNDILLAYLIFPIVMDINCISELKIIKAKSTIYRLVRNKNCMAGFYERLSIYKDITNTCLQYALDNHYISIDDELRVKVLKTEGLKSDIFFNKNIKLASKLPLIFKQIDVINIYQIFSIKEL